MSTKLRHLFLRGLRLAQQILDLNRVGSKGLFDTIYINKTKDLQPEPGNHDFIEIKLWSKGDGEEEN